MLKNYVLVAFQHLLKQKLYTLINLTGLAVGLACFILIGLFVRHELAYDRGWANADRIYRISRDFLPTDISKAAYLATMPSPAAAVLEEDFPGIEQTARIMRFGATFRSRGRHALFRTLRRVGRQLALRDLRLRMATRRSANGARGAPVRGADAQHRAEVFRRRRSAWQDAGTRRPYAAEGHRRDRGLGRRHAPAVLAPDVDAAAAGELGSQRVLHLRAPASWRERGRHSQGLERLLRAPFRAGLEQIHAVRGHAAARHSS